MSDAHHGLEVRPDGSIVVPMQSRRQQRAVAVQKINHIIPAFGLLGAGLAALRQGQQGLVLGLAIFEIAVSAALLVSAAKLARQAARKVAAHEHHGVDWVDVFAAGVLAAEAAERYHQTHHYARPVILTAVLLLILGLVHGRVVRFTSGRRGFRINDQGIRIAGKPFRTFHAKWSEIASVEMAGRFGVVRTFDGRGRRIDLDDLTNADEVRDALHEVERRLAPVQPTTT